MNTHRIRPGEDIPVGISEFVRENDRGGHYLLYFRPVEGGPIYVSMLYYDMWGVAFKREVMQS